MKDLSKTLSQLSSIQKKIEQIPVGETGVVELKRCIQKAHYLAKNLITLQPHSDDYYRNHLLYLLLSNSHHLDLYGICKDASRQSLLFNRCQRYAVSGIGDLLQRFETPN